MNSPSHPTSNGSTISTPSSPGGADINSLRQQLREAKATIQSLSLQAKLSSKQVAFGSSVPTGRLVPASPQTQPSSTPAIDPPSPSRLNASTSGSIFETTVSLSLRSARRSISPAGNQSSGDNPFFGGNGTSRERLKNSESSKNSGSGKVISGLQVSAPSLTMIFGCEQAAEFHVRDCAVGFESGEIDHGFDEKSVEALSTRR